MLVYHGSGVAVEYPEIRRTKYCKDFSWGFYCTVLPDQAVKWAERHTHGNNVPTVNVYEYYPQDSLRIKTFSEMSDEWLDFICACRTGHVHEFDVVEGPMADDTIWNYVEDFLDGEFSRAAFWELVKFRYPTHQISFHTAKALSCLTFVRSERV